MRPRARQDVGRVHRVTAWLGKTILLVQTASTCCGQTPPAGPDRVPSSKPAVYASPHGTSTAGNGVTNPLPPSSTAPGNSAESTLRLPWFPMRPLLLPMWPGQAAHAEQLAPPTRTSPAPITSPYFMPGNPPQAQNLPKGTAPLPPNQANASSANQPDRPTLEPLSPQASTTTTLQRQVFDPMQVHLRHEGGHWLLMAGDHVLKRFPRQDTEAMLALHVVRFYRFNERWTLGAGDAAIEFWWSFGQPPRGRIPGVQTIPLHLEQWHVRQVGTDYWLTDGVHRYFRFRSATDAEQALAIMRQFRLNQVAVIGRPQPIMIYFLADAGSH